MKVRLVLRLAAVLVSVLLGLAALDIFSAGGGQIAFWRIELPHSRDPRLVGKWQGIVKTIFGDPRSRVTILRADGTGESTSDTGFRKPFDWGTEDGVLYTRRMATDAWSGSRHPYAVSADKNIVQFAGLKMFDLVAPDMRRQ